jgi:dihydroorotase-like cyclic amidohydrolase
MCFSTTDCPFLEDDTFYAHLEILAKNGGIAMIHCENDKILKKREIELKAEGKCDGRAYNASHPDYAEVEAIQRAILFLKQTGAAAVIVHVSTAEGLRLIKKAREEGVKVWAETCPHYLTFVVEDYDRLGAALKQSPPFHEEPNRLEMWDLLGKDGYVSTMSSDHCPFTEEEKFADPNNIWIVPNGIPGVQAIAPVMLNGVAEGKITLEKVVEVTSFNASKLYGLYPKKGVLQPGSDADFVVVDMDLKKEFKKEDNFSKCPWSPFFGYTFQGWPVMTVCRGEIVFKDGKIVGKQGYGKYVAREK